jgi:hypothetical protein
MPAMRADHESSQKYISYSLDLGNPYGCPTIALGIWQVSLERISFLLPPPYKAI